MDKQVKLNRTQFEHFLHMVNYNRKDDYDFLYAIYDTAVSALIDVYESKILGDFEPINHADVIQYALGEFVYSVAQRSESQILEFKNSEQNIEMIASVVADKYLSLTKLIHNEGKLVNKYLPPISSLYIYVNFIAKILNNYIVNHRDTKNVVVDLLNKSTSIARCTIDLLNSGFETQAFSTWRTLHECECTLIVLQKYGKEALDAYLKHMRYGFAFKDTMEDKDKQTEIFMAMKEEMKGHNLKSKDIKKYIEYGWLYACSDFKEEEGYKLNFRDGLEKLAGLSTYASRYETSSEIIHSTPLLIYSSKEYFYYVTLISLYESFFRLEKAFLSLFLEHSDEEAIEKYAQMRKIYYSQLVHIHKRETDNFKKWKEQTQKSGE